MYTLHYISTYMYNTIHCTCRLFLHIRSHEIMLYLYSLIWYKKYVMSTDSNEVHRKTDTLFPGNNTTAAELKPLVLTIRSGGSSSNH